jgi:hypothetical protein
VTCVTAAVPRLIGPRWFSNEALKLANARISPPIFKEDEPKAD